MGILSFFNKQNDKLDLDKILSIERSDMEIDEHLNKISNYCEDAEKLNFSQKILIVIENLEREINNGGFDQFYWNSSGDFANKTVDYLKVINANHTAEIVSTANAQWPKSHIPSDKTEREVLHEKIADTASEIWQKCDADFFKYEDDISGLLLEFVKKNRQDFE